MTQFEKPGSVVYIKYLDHVLFKDVDPLRYARPFVREAVGWLDHEDGESVRLVWERFAEPDPGGKARQKATGLVILKSNILERKCLNNKICIDMYGKYGRTDLRDPAQKKNAGAAKGARQEGRELRRRDQPLVKWGGKA
jgi:hypothetical protein